MVFILPEHQVLSHTIIFYVRLKLLGVMRWDQFFQMKGSNYYASQIIFMDLKVTKSIDPHCSST